MKSEGNKNGVINQITVLYIDNDELFLKKAESYLRDNGFNLKTSTGTDDAAKVLNTIKFDAIVSENKIPECDAIGLLNKIRGRDDRTPFIIFTEAKESDFVVEALNSGVDHYIFKEKGESKNLEELSESIQKLVLERKNDIMIHSFFYTNSDLMFVKDDKFRYILGNDAILEFFGVNANELVNKTDADLMERQAAEGCMASDLKAIETGMPVVTEETAGDKIFETVKFPIEIAPGKTGVGGIIRDISKRKKTERELTDTRNLTDSIIEAIPDILVRSDKVGRILDVYTTDESNLIMPKSELIGKSIPDIFSGELGESLLKTVHTTISEKRQVRVEYPLVKDGIELYYEARVVPYQKDETIAFIRDITDRVLTEKALKNSEEQYRTIFENANDLILIHEITPDYETGRIVDANSITENLLEYSIEELKKLKISDIVVPEDPEKTAEIKEEISKTGKAVFEGRINGKSGQIIQVEVSSNRAMLHGSLVSISIARDIRERIDLLDRLRMAIDGGELGTWDWDVPSGKAIYNAKWAEMLGYTLDEIPEESSSWEKLIYPPDRESVIAEVNKNFEGIIPSYETEYRLVGKDGQLVWVLSKGRVIERDRDGKPVRMVGTHLDITQRKEAEDELKRKNEELAAVEEELRKQLDEIVMQEQTLKENEAYIRTVLDNIPIGVAVNSVDPEVNFDYFNDNFLKIYRVSEDALKSPDSFWESVYHDPKQREELKIRVLEDNASGDPERMHWEDVPIAREGEETTYISARNVPLESKGLVISMVWDVTEQKKADDRIRLHLSRVKSLLDLYQTASESETELMSHALESSRTMTESQYGFIGLMTSDESEMIIHKWSKGVMEKCSVQNNPVHFQVHSAGLWADCVRERTPVMVNDYLSVDTGKRGLPKGHVEIKRFLAVPIFDYGKITAVLVVANKESLYNNEDQDALTTLGNLMWEIIKSRKSEENLKDREERLRAIVENLPHGIVNIIDKDLRYIFNAGSELKTAGYTDDMLSGKTVYEILQPYNAEMVASHIRQVFETGETVSFEDVYGEHTFLVRMTPLRSPTGAIENVLELSVNISAQKKAEEEFKREKELFRSTFESLEDAAFVLDNDPAVIRAANGAAEKIFGYTHDEMIGKNISILHVNRESFTEFDKFIYPYVKTHRKVPRFEFRMKRKDGTVFPTEHSISALFAYSKTQTARVSIIRDITELKESRQRESDAMKKIEQNLKQLSTLNDEIRNPLTVITGVLDMNFENSDEIILDQVKVIDEIIDKLDQGWIESAKTREFLKKHLEMNED